MSSFNPRRPAERTEYRWKRTPKTSHSQHYEIIMGGAVIKYKDGREVCQNNAAGRREYASRVEAMCQRQNWKCCCSLTCTKRLVWWKFQVGDWWQHQADCSIDFTLPEFVKVLRGCRAGLLRLAGLKESC